MTHELEAIVATLHRLYHACDASQLDKNIAALMIASIIKHVSEPRVVIERKNESSVLFRFFE